MFRLMALTILVSVILASSFMTAAQANSASDFGGLRAAILAGNATIVLDDDITLAGELPAITGALSIDGKGHSISGDKQFRVFAVDGGSLTIANATLSDGKAEAGGAILMRNDASLIIETSTFAGNIAETSGGAIHANGGNLQIRDSRFEKNCARRLTKILNPGGQGPERLEQTIDEDGCPNATHYRSRLEDDSEIPGEGGAIQLLNGARAVIEGSTFSENKATNGGAIAASSDSVRLRIEGSSFDHNQTSSVAGAIYADRGAIQVASSSFVKNAADSGGGAIAVQLGKLDVVNSSFSENQTESGAGAIAIQSDARVTITHASFVNNWSLHREAGAIQKRMGGAIRLRNSIIAGAGRGEDCVGGLDQNIGNISPDGTCAIKASGDPLLGELTGMPAFHEPLDHSPALDAADPRFCTDTDQLGRARSKDRCDSGAIEASGAEIAPAPIVPPPACSLADQIIAANSDRPSGGCPAGKGADTISLIRNILLFAPLPSITSVITIEGNGHTISGDGKFRIFDVDRGNLTVKNLTITEGRASSGAGGAIRLQNRASATVFDSQFIRNRADVGGAIAVNAASGRTDRLTVRDSFFHRNSAGRTGGALDLNFGSAVISGSSFTRNSAGQSGGAISLLNYPRLEASNSSFISNTAGWGGSTLGVENGARATLTHVTVYSSSVFALQRFESGFGARSAINLRNSLITGRQYVVHCSGEFSENVGNLSPSASCEPMLKVDPLLEEPSADSSFLAPLPGSPAIQAADPRFCSETDQLGTPRAQVGRCDIGAIETAPVETALAACAVTTTYNLNFRDQPAGQRLGNVLNNTTLPALGRTPGWFHVEHDGATGWISAEYVTTEGDCG